MKYFETIKYEKTDRIVRISLNRPNTANGFDAILASELASAATLCDKDSQVKVVILTGEGKFFSAGGDLKAMSQYEGGAGSFVKELADDLHRAISTFARMDAPLIVAVNGVAAGAGFSLAIAGDLVVASDSASFTMAYSRAGLSPDGSSSFYLPRLVGVRKAQELMFTNKTLSATDALDWGLINYVVPASELDEKANELANFFSVGAKSSNAIIKKLLLSTFSHGLEEQMEIEGRFISQCADSSDGREGLNAFLNKRKPKFE